MSDDGVIGGYSSSRMQFLEHNSNDDNSDATLSPTSSSSLSSSSPPFLRWSGTIDTRINPHSQLSRGITRSGFAAILSPEYPFGAPLSNQYKALEICCRIDAGRTYAVNLHVETYFPEDMYQGFIVGTPSPQSPSDSNEENGGDDMHNGIAQQQLFHHQQHLPQRDNAEFDATNNDATETIIANTAANTSGEQSTPTSSLDVREHLRNRRNLIRKTYLSSDDHPYYGHPPLGFQRYILPFKNFVLTSRGRMRHSQRILDGAVNIESIGFTLMDGKDGDFVFDLVSLRAVNVLEGEVVGSLQDEAREEELRDRLRTSSDDGSSSSTEEKEKNHN